MNGLIYKGNWDMVGNVTGSSCVKWFNIIQVSGEWLVMKGLIERSSNRDQRVNGSEAV